MLPRHRLWHYPHGLRLALEESISRKNPEDGHPIKGQEYWLIEAKIRQICFYVPLFS